ncbi:TonB-dependent siderophore receptor [Pseudomonas mucidolens]|uniref:Outer-membrane receptor for ferric coprogen and ferric-rhodotorulic acid n=1 Tax=Pseudomonas mucidolens TaxID=46679 RepID=A0A1H2MLE1_9PSED|nr:TonB-dependent siderophore receptor [Pseudomonas mucidolens]SDU93798.1 outer-membrane receptor for ferric coprogen and ferric-rhodotorulic acid [Pseudomonas mucidolens]SQH33674.1 TonB-dependent siderophore receptor [Pseudomonas mucidolens]
MFAPITRSMTLTVGLFSGVLSPDLLAENAVTRERNDSASVLELVSTHITADNLGSATEDTGSYTTGAMSTATRLNLSIKETPQSVSVVTRQQMDDFKLGSLSEVMNQTTGVVVQRNDSERFNFYSRGYSIQNFQIDGMLNTFSGLKSDSDTIIYDRIEVVRGATGLTTGAGDPSGTINMVRKRPTADWAAKVGASAGSYDNYYSYVDVGGPLGFDGRLRGRTVLAYRDSKSFRDRYALERKVGYGILEADLTEDTVLAVGYDYQDKQIEGATWGSVPYWNSLGGKANMPRSNNITTSWSNWPLTDRTLFATLDQRLSNDWRLKAAYTHRESETDGKVYYGGGGYPNPDRSGISAYSRHFKGDDKMDAVDFNVAGSYSLLGREHEAMFGYGQARHRDSSPYIVSGKLPVDYLHIPDWANTGDIPEFADETTDQNGDTASTYQKAGYLATRLSLSDNWHAVLGSRYGSWKTSSSSYEYKDRQLVRINHSGQTQKDVWTPYAGLLYDINQDFTVYASYTDIFKPQTEQDVSNKYLEPIVGRSYEIGLKGSMLNDRLTFSSAVFRTIQDNVAEIDDSVPPGPQGEEYYKSGGKGNKVQGFEVELSGELRADWNVKAGYTYTHSVNGDKERNNTAQPLNLLRASTTYRLPGQWRGLTVGAGVNWQSDIYRHAQRPVGRGTDGKLITQSTAIRQEAYAVVNLMSRYEFDKNLSASLNVNNLFDKKYYNNVGFYNGVYWGDPRTMTLSLDWKI